ncbi:lipocalin/fatty acid-binding family protein [Constantimarinum furrinae]|uniref:Lipocalin-like domain-containing protein n=1 Tax=Constantimarinum furrinae TaxID=2562285 RepID=A0A7G8PTU2_9FLAO|nr:hypothetical protein [Constantimarinum furrinae]QNJ97758.1 hypothetical protein ALE3EI_1189 [Constantimarinum furrinae]
MKRILLLLIVAVAVTACSKNDDDSGNNGSVSVEGNWKLTSFTTENEYDLNGDETASNDVMAETECYQNETIVFNGNASGTANSTSYADITLELVAGTTNEYEYSVTCVEEDDATQFAWVQTGDTVTLTFAGFSYIGTKVDDQITIVLEEGLAFEVEDGNGGTVLVTEDITFVYTKQ